MDKKCPKCAVAWQSDQTITEYFIEEYNKNGIPRYCFDENPDATVEIAAATTAFNYGCTPATPKYFGQNVIGIEFEGVYDGVLYWECKKCGCAKHRFTGKVTNSVPAQPKLH